MIIPGAPSLLLLAYLFVVLPRLAIRSAARMAEVRDRGPAARPLSRSAVWTSTLIGQAVLLALAVFAGLSFGFDFVGNTRLGSRDGLAGLLALAAAFLLRALLRALRTEPERRRLLVYQFVPRTGREWGLAILATLLAGVAEEAAYRGVAVAILRHASASLPVAVVLSAVAFGMAHAVQGLKSAAIVTAMALVFHALVITTGTLALAIAVHVIYDLVAGLLIARQLDRDAVTPVTAPAS